MQTQLFLQLITILGAGISVYVGVRVALAEIRRDIRALENSLALYQRTTDTKHDDVVDRIKRLEAGYFIK